MASAINSTVSLRGLVLGVLMTVSVQAAGNAAVFDIGSKLDPFIYVQVSLEVPFSPQGRHIFSKLLNIFLVLLNC